MWRDWVREVIVYLGLVEKPDLVASYMSDYPAPHELAPGRLVVVRDEGLMKWACFRCPGGCGERIQLSLNSSRRPRWAVIVDWMRRPSLDPSVRQVNACRCHFWLKGGRIEWCADSGHKQRNLNQKMSGHGRFL